MQARISFSIFSTSYLKSTFGLHFVPQKDFRNRPQDAIKSIQKPNHFFIEVACRSLAQLCSTWRPSWPPIGHPRVFQKLCQTEKSGTLEGFRPNLGPTWANLGQLGANLDKLPLLDSILDPRRPPKSTPRCYTIDSKNNIFFY